MSQNFQNIAKFQKFQLENLVDFEKCCKTHIFLQKSVPIQPKTTNILPKFCQPTLSDVSAAGVSPKNVTTTSTDVSGVGKPRMEAPRRVRSTASATSGTCGRAVRSAVVPFFFFAARFFTEFCPNCGEIQIKLLEVDVFSNGKNN